jgi:hypothetical protein
MESLIPLITPPDLDHGRSTIEDLDPVIALLETARKRRNR